MSLHGAPTITFWTRIQEIRRVVGKHGQYPDCGLGQVESTYGWYDASLVVATGAGQIVGALGKNPVNGFVIGLDSWILSTSLHLPPFIHSKPQRNTTALQIAQT